MQSSSDAAKRAETRFLLMYNLELQQPLRGARYRPLTEALSFGRLASHVDASGALLPNVVLDDEIGELWLCSQGVLSIPLEGRIIVAFTPRGEALLLLDVTVRVYSAEDVASLLFFSWRDRSKIRIDKQSLTAWLGERLHAEGIIAPGNPKFGRNVHQCVFAGGELANSLLARTPDQGMLPEIIKIVLRGTLDGNRGSPLGIKRPEVLNNPQQTLVAHGRGVSLIVGWTEAVENTFALAALGILNAVATIHRVRRHAFDALTLNDTTDLKSIAEARALVSRLTNRLTDLQLDLAFSVEAYADTLLIPELLIESFHSSLRQVSALSEGTANTSQIVERVASAIRARQVMLDAATQEYAESRDKVFAAIIAIGTVIALPPALLLAFFGANVSDVDPNRSILDVGHYALAYALAWLPFLIVVVVGALVRRRVRVRIPGVYSINN